MGITEKLFLSVILDERYLAGYAAGIQRMQRALKQKQQISPPKKFYLAEQL